MQKGVVGITLPQSDMPFTKNGIVPDLIINPQAFPKRMTIGQLLELLTGKVAALKGCLADGTPFQNVDMEATMDELEKLGYNRDATEEMYSGFTGKKIRTKIVIGPTYYFRLKHIVIDKIHSRARGPKTILTRQPPEGKTKDGGLRLGEMERDALLGHGCAFFLKEKLLDTSDAFCIQVCDICGLMVPRMVKQGSKPYPTEDDSFYCTSCNNKTRISKIIVSYAFKLMLQLIMALNIAPRIRTEQIS